VFIVRLNEIEALNELIKMKVVFKVVFDFFALLIELISMENKTIGLEV